MGRLAKDTDSNPIQVLRPFSTEKLAISGTAASAAALTSDTNVVRVVSDIDCYINLEATATTSHMLLPAGVVEYMRLDASDTLSCIAGGAGSLYVTEMV